MFTGLVEETGTIARIDSRKDAIRLAVVARKCALGTRAGDSIAVNGCCLTVVKTSPRKSGRILEFDLLQETWNRTNLHQAREGGVVNLERSLKVSDRFGGHFVTGHIDGTAKISRWERTGNDWVLDVAAGPDLMRYILFKGAVALDGISLTVAELIAGGFRIWIIPHTYEVTALRERAVGGLVNIEADLLGKYVEKFVSLRSSI